MNQFERMAIFTVIENVEAQLRGLKSLIATAANMENPSEHKVTKTGDLRPKVSLDEKEDEDLEKALEYQRVEHAKQLSKEAEKHYQAEFNTVLSAMDTVNG